MKTFRFTKKNITILTLAFIPGLLILGFSVVLHKQAVLPLWNEQIYDLAAVNPLDAFFAQPYSHLLDFFGDVSLLAAHFVLFIGILAFPLLNCLSEKNSLLKKQKLSTIFFDFLVYGQCWIYTTGIYKTLKTVAGRIRPYMYFENPSSEGILKGDFNRSWPSGHSSAVFIAVAFILCWILTRDIKKQYKITLACLALFFGLATITLRILSGNHFVTDILSGTALGSLVTSTIFLLNQKLLFNLNSEKSLEN